EYTPQTMNLSVFAEAIIDEFRLIDQGAHRLVFHDTLHSQVEADPRLLRHILTNLISNAIKYSPAETEIRVVLSESEGTIDLMVRDQGVGIPADSLPRLSEPFHRASNAQGIKGTGLGLTIVRECIERHQGHFEVESVVGKGTTVTVKLPR
ncbi:MAG: sensor histidine kinase, partial [Anaerolineae bacterium]|nr:sensor histidine kinase [Anaerolineae bacterium]